MDKDKFVFQISASHDSPKIWDIFQRFQSFSKRKLLTRTLSGLLESCDEEASEAFPKEISPDAEQTVNEKNDEDDSINRVIVTSAAVIEKLSAKQEEPSSGGDRKRRLIEIIDYEEEQPAVKRKAQPASCFKPKCLNFDEIEEIPNYIKDSEEKEVDTNSFGKTKYSANNDLETKRVDCVEETKRI